jgi:hypothetical protein
LGTTEENKTDKKETNKKTGKRGAKRILTKIDKRLKDQDIQKIIGITQIEAAIVGNI